MKDDLFKNFSGWVEENKSLAEIAAYKIGGPARFFVTPKKEDDIEKVLRVSKEKGIELYVMGSGTNLLISDSGFEGIILWLGPSETLTQKLIKVVKQDSESVTIKVPSNFGKAQLLDYALKNNLSGLEFSAGIPGSLGGAIYMNAGTKWGSYGGVVTEVEFISVTKGKYSLMNSEIGFRYRGLGEGLLLGDTIVSAVTIKLRKSTDMKQVLSIVDEIYSYRGLRQPLELPNCGSVFKNPENSERGAGRLIEAAGLKGEVVGGAEVSLKHANFILNTGIATAANVKTLIRKIQDKVIKKFSVQLEPEVVSVGKFNS